MEKTIYIFELDRDLQEEQDLTVIEIIAESLEKAKGKLQETLNELNEFNKGCYDYILELDDFTLVNECYITDVTIRTLSLGY
jgi:hypothetical protein